MTGVPNYKSGEKCIISDPYLTNRIALNQIERKPQALLNIYDIFLQIFWLRTTGGFFRIKLGDLPEDLAMAILVSDFNTRGQTKFEVGREYEGLTVDFNISNLSTDNGKRKPNFQIQIGSISVSFNDPWFDQVIEAIERLLQKEPELTIKYQINQVLNQIELRNTHNHTKLNLNKYPISLIKDLIKHPTIAVEASKNKDFRSYFNSFLKELNLPVRYGPNQTEISNDQLTQLSTEYELDLEITNTENSVPELVLGAKKDKRYTVKMFCRELNQLYDHNQFLIATTFLQVLYNYFAKLENQYFHLDANDRENIFRRINYLYFVQQSWGQEIVTLLNRWFPESSIIINPGQKIYLRYAKIKENDTILVSDRISTSGDSSFSSALNLPVSANGFLQQISDHLVNEPEISEKLQQIENAINQTVEFIKFCPPLPNTLPSNPEKLFNLIPSEKLPEVLPEKIVQYIYNKFSSESRPTYFGFYNTFEVGFPEGILHICCYNADKQKNKTIINLRNQAETSIFSTLCLKLGRYLEYRSRIALFEGQGQSASCETLSRTERMVPALTMLKKLRRNLISNLSYMVASNSEMIPVPVSLFEPFNSLLSQNQGLFGNSEIIYVTNLIRIIEDKAKSRNLTDYDNPQQNKLTCLYNPSSGHYLKLITKYEYVESQNYDDLHVLLENFLSADFKDKLRPFFQITRDKLASTQDYDLFFDYIMAYFNQAFALSQLTRNEDLKHQSMRALRDKIQALTIIRQVLLETLKKESFNLSMITDSSDTNAILMKPLIKLQITRLVQLVSLTSEYGMLFNVDSLARILYTRLSLFAIESSNTLSKFEIALREIEANNSEILNRLNLTRASLRDLRGIMQSNPDTKNLIAEELTAVSENQKRIIEAIKLLALTLSLNSERNLSNLD
ncbi:MAG: hypothetical protein OHK0017_07070 [Patescibacteria group bacterium]